MIAWYEVLWVGNKTREWSSKHGGSFIDYHLKVKGPDGIESTAVTTRKPESPVPAVGDKIYGHIEEETITPRDGGDPFVKRKLKRVQVPQEAPQASSGAQAGPQGPGSSKPAPTPRSSADSAGTTSPKGDAFWAAKDRRIGRAGVVQAAMQVVEPLTLDDVESRKDRFQRWVAAVNQVADAIEASLEARTPSPNGRGADSPPPAPAPSYVPHPDQAIHTGADSSSPDPGANLPTVDEALSDPSILADDGSVPF